MHHQKFVLFQQIRHDCQTNTIDIFRISRDGQTFLSQTNGILSRRDRHMFLQRRLLHVARGKVDFHGQNTRQRSGFILRRRHDVMRKNQSRGMKRIFNISLFSRYQRHGFRSNIYYAIYAHSILAKMQCCGSYENSNAGGLFRMRPRIFRARSRIG